MELNETINSNQNKIAEKLIVLNNHGIGMLARVWNIKKECTDNKDSSSKPAFLNDKSLESTFKQITKKFPVIEKGSLVCLILVYIDTIDPQIFPFGNFGFSLWDFT